MSTTGLPVEKMKIHVTIINGYSLIIINYFAQ